MPVRTQGPERQGANLSSFTTREVGAFFVAWKKLNYNKRRPYRELSFTNMDVMPVLKPVFDKLGLDADGLQQRLHFLDWSAADGERLRRIAHFGEQASNDFVEALYQRLGQYPETRAILRGEGLVDRLKHSQRGYYGRLFSGEIDQSYLEERVRIGHIHEKVGVELKWYLGAYRLYLSHMLRGWFDGLSVEQQSRLADFDSLLKIVFFDMSLAADAYIDAEHRALEASEARYAHALRGANDGIWDWDLQQDQLYVSERWASMLGLTPAQVGQRSMHWFERVHPDDQADLQAAIQQHLHGGSPWIRHEYRMRRSDGSYLWVLTRGVVEMDVSGRRRLAGSQTDISERQRFQRELEHAAQHDPLTGLINRHQLGVQLQRTASQLSRPGARHAALLFIDLDRFKLINDSLGHAAGDRVLLQVAERLRGCLRPGDQLARFGGDEFVMLLDDLACAEDAEVVAARVLAALREPLCFGERCLVVSASIGVAPLLPGQGLEEALQAADMALYSAKDAGKARFERYNQSMQERARQRLKLESNVLQALQRGEFSLNYQPIFDLTAPHKAPVAVEVLLRWSHAGESVSPAAFIPVLEESAEIIPVGYWVLEQACRQTLAWQRDGAPGLHCSVNLSGRQLQEPNFVSRLRQILQSAGLPAQSLVLEITESLLIDHDAGVLASLRELAELGVRIALDDFGTGYCSLGYLNRFPLHIIKLDRSFLHEAHENPRQLTICRAIIALSKSLGLSVVAEGIEHLNQVELMLQEGCTLGQGFKLGRPMSAADLQRQLFH